ncbi:hypothetical protein Tco_0873528 [Tanacetum coccineum]|uniref:Gag-Pol polyprotein n=1 Tax=Tanacetum coccineum TaxID=301880 RepID=A0ABQ5BLY8_9ASTR
MHNNIMAAGSRDRPPMLAMGRYVQWQSRFLRYIDTRPNGDALRKCILKGPYKLSTVTIPAVPAIDDSLEVPKQTAVETLLNMSPENKEHYQSEKEAVHLLLTGIRDEIYSIVDACKIAHDMWIAIERLQQVATMQVNVQFLQQLQPEWSRFVKIVKQNHDLDTISYHKHFDVLKQYQKENVDTSPRYKNDNQIGQFGNQRTVTVAGSRETVGNHVKKRCDVSKQAEKGVRLQVEQADWIKVMDEEIDEQELEAHYNYMVTIQEVPIANSGTDTEPLEQVEYDAEYNLFANDRQDSEQPESISNTCVVEQVDSNAILIHQICVIMKSRLTQNAED